MVALQHGGEPLLVHANVTQLLVHDGVDVGSGGNLPLEQGAGVAAVGVGFGFAGGELMEAKSISNLAFKVPPIVVKESNAVGLV